MANPFKLREFVKYNFNIIFSSTNKSKAIKDASKRFFIKELNKKFGIAKPVQIAEESICLLIKSKKIGSIEELKKSIENIPFLRNNIINFEKFENQIKTSKECIISRDDLAKIESEEFRKKIQDKLMDETKDEIDKIRNEKIQDLEEKEKILLKEGERLAKIKEELDSLHIDDELVEKEFEYFTEEERKETKNIWWKELGFIGDPFPGENKGLIPTVESRFTHEKDISEEKRIEFFDNILIRNDIFNDFDTRINKNLGDFLGNSFVMIGGFGSGKSVLFEFVEMHASKNNILCIPVWINCKKDIDELYRDLYKQILRSPNLKRRYSELVGIELGSRVNNFDKEEVCDVLSEIKSVVDIRGVLFIIDGMHIMEDLSKNALKFVKSLQNLSEPLNQFGIKSTFMIAGALKWINDIKQDSGLSGSVSKRNVITLPEADSSIAYEMFNKRFKAFSKDKNNFSHISKNNIERTYKILRKRLSRPVSFRDYIDELIPSVKEGDLKNIYINPLYSHEILNKIYNLLEKEDTSLFEKINYVKKYFSKYPKNVIKIMKVLIGISSFKSKDSRFFSENRTFLSLLLKFGLIKEGISSNTVGVRPSDIVSKFDAKLKNEFGYRFNDIILALSREKILAAENKKLYYEELPEEIKIIQNLLIQNPEWKSELEDIFQDVLKVHSEIIETRVFSESIVNKCKDSICLLFSALFKIIKIPNKGFKEFQEINEYILSEELKWLFDYIKVYETFYNKIYKIQNEGATENVVYAELIADYKRAFLAITKIIQDSVRTHHIMSINHPLFKISDMARFYKIRKEYMETNYTNTAKEFGIYYEEKMRLNLHNIFRIKYGEDYRFSLGVKVNQSIKTNQDKSDRSIYHKRDNPNFLYDADRLDYAYLILDNYRGQNNKSQNWNHVFSYIFYSIPRNTLEHYFTIIHPFITGDAHHWHKSVWEDNLDHLREAMSYFAKICQSLNNSYLLLLDANNILIEKGNDNEKGKIYFSFYADCKDKDSLKPLIINTTVFNRIWAYIDSLIQSDKEVKINFEEPLDIEHKFKCKYDEFIGTLAYGIKKQKIKLEFSSGNYVLVKP
ncbi:MAG: hypothetical protein KAK00_07645 [Nanoarchaeota archaeon]|nr:hypothetical protein [Nanoarchaeota archaeon]